MSSKRRGLPIEPFSDGVWECKGIQATVIPNVGDMTDRNSIISLSQLLQAPHSNKPLSRKTSSVAPSPR
jgi:hypothetical protein